MFKGCETATFPPRLSLSALCLITRKFNEKNFLVFNEVSIILRSPFGALFSREFLSLSLSRTFPRIWTFAHVEQLKYSQKGMKKISAIVVQGLKVMPWKIPSRKSPKNQVFFSVRLVASLCERKENFSIECFTLKTDVSAFSLSFHRRASDLPS